MLLNVYLVMDHRLPPTPFAFNRLRSTVLILHLEIALAPHPSAQMIYIYIHALDNIYSDHISERLSRRTCRSTCITLSTVRLDCTNTSL